MHTHWDAEDANGAPGLFDHVLYPQAKGYNEPKRTRNVDAAMELIDDIVNEATLDGIYDSYYYDHHREEPPLLVAPAASLDESNNALAISYAHWLAHEFDWEVEERIYQSKVVSRDRQGAWFRLAHRCEFYGVVTSGRNYIIVDDVMTLGGTLADLRGFIEGNGGRVIGMSALAHRSGGNVQISLAKATLFGLQSRYEQELTEFCRKELGYDPECLTEPEAGRLLTAPPLDRVREALDGVRHQGDARRGPRRPGRASS